MIRHPIDTGMIETMKTGKITQAVLDRSVLRVLKKHKAAGSFDKIGSDSARFQTGSGSFTTCVTEALPLVASDGLTPEMILTGIENSLAADGAQLQELTLSILWPEAAEESELKKLMEKIAIWCGDHSVTVAAGHTQVSHLVNAAVLSLTGVGTAFESVDRFGSDVDETADMTAVKDTPSHDVVKSCEDKHAGDRSPNGYDLIMAGTCGLAGTVIVTRAGRDQLKLRYPGVLLDEAERLESRLSVQEAAREAAGAGTFAMKDVSRGGVFGALWELGEKTGLGFTVELKKIPIRQETVEICEFYDLNPYQLYGEGGLLIITDSGKALCDKLRQAGTPAEIIGHVTEGKGRVILNGEEQRFLDKPQQDMLEVFREKLR